MAKPRTDTRTHAHANTLGKRTFSFFCIRVLRFSRGRVLQRWRWSSSILNRKKSFLETTKQNNDCHTELPTSAWKQTYLHLLPEPGDHRHLLVWEEKLPWPGRPWRRLLKKELVSHVVSKHFIFQTETHFQVIILTFWNSHFGAWRCWQWRSNRDWTGPLAWRYHHSLLAQVYQGFAEERLLQRAQADSYNTKLFTGLKSVRKKTCSPNSLFESFIKPEDKLETYPQVCSSCGLCVSWPALHPRRVSDPLCYRCQGAALHTVINSSH